MAIKKQTVAEILAVAILVVHVGSIGALWLVEGVVDPNSSSGLEIDKIIYPVTAIYAVACVNWIIGNQRTEDDTPVRRIYVIGVAIASLFLIALPFGIYGIYQGFSLFSSTERANTYFAAVESAFGAIFVLFFNDLFKSNVPIRESNVSSSSVGG